MTEIILKEIRTLKAMQSKAADSKLTVGGLKDHDHHIEILCSESKTTLERVLMHAQDRDLINLVRTTLQCMYSC